MEQIKKNLMSEPILSERQSYCHHPINHCRCEEHCTGIYQPYIYKYTQIGNTGRWVFGAGENQIKPPIYNIIWFHTVSHPHNNIIHTCISCATKYMLYYNIKIDRQNKNKFSFKLNIYQRKYMRDEQKLCFMWYTT